MAINKKLVHFDTKTIFDQKLAEKEILDTSVVFIKDSNIIHTRGEDYQFIGWSVLGTVGPAEPNVPAGYRLFNLMGEGNNDSPYWTDVNGEIIFVKE